MAFWKKNKSASIADRLADEHIYERVLQEIESGTRRGGLWLKALENSQGDEKRAKLLYISYRVQAMKDEIAISMALQEAEEKQTHNRLNGYDANGHTPLMRAVMEINPEQVASLLAQGADPKIKDGNFGTSTASDLAVRALRRAATEQDRTKLRRIFDVLDAAERRA